MILIGQYDSPFVRRVGIALKLYELPFEHRPWSVFGDAEKIRPYNPLTRVPTLVLDDGLVLVESHGILDYLDGRVAAERRLFPVTEPARHWAVRTAGLAMGFAEKAVSLFYELKLHREVSQVWAERCRAQILATLSVLETERSQQGDGPAGRIGHADIALAVAWRFLMEAHPGIASPGDYPTLAREAARLEALPVFQAIAQPFIPPA
ncbi:glutathione S-transferase family protein [Bosea sp. BIWAKO-01]|uniref:glutathione S-transferase family protein n=1 Tax=Bosea sp. BIWAKO-01 TaxID=506668 RepID=UPI0008531340|nr:glutathione S-transferase family protein [Bosea sp. BIWAKO-01]GAU80470.1 glutathione S-transferase [Bosea sp. BIWAKO-01]